MPPREIDDETFDFENREKELVKFVDLSIRNHQKNTRYNSDNTGKLILPIASQMLGSGKTWFGRFMLKSLAKNMAKLQTKFDKSALAYLASSHYVLMDMRNVGNPYTTRGLIKRLLDSLIFFSPSAEFQAEALKYWVNRPISNISITDVGSWFYAKLGQPILFHFDEVDSIASQNSPVRKLSLNY